MDIKNSFKVALPPDQAMAILRDVERIAPCLPGAEIVEVVDDRTFKGKVSVRLGPVGLTFAGTARFEDINDADHSAIVHASGRDQKGRGNANAKVSFSLTEEADGTRVNILTDLKLAGAVAQYGRGVGMISDLASQLIGQFADNLNAQLAAESTVDGQAPDQPGEASAPPPEARPINALSLLATVVWNAIKRLFGRA